MASDSMLSLCQQLSINESRLFYIAIQAMNEQLRQGIWQEILLSTAAIVQLFGGNKGYYDQLKKIAARLVKKKVMVNHKLCDLFRHILIIYAVWALVNEKYRTWKEKKILAIMAQKEGQRKILCPCWVFGIYLCGSG